MVIRSCTRRDIPALGKLYFEAYPPGAACTSIEEAEADIRASFDGEYGELWLEASPVILHGDQIIAALMTVGRASWDGTPDCPFIIEVFTAHAWRRRGLARTLLDRARAVVAAKGENAIALQVDEENTVALILYRNAGFLKWMP